jgi:hypothetical protein
VNEEMAASTSRVMSSTQCATTPSLHALRNTPMKLLFVRVALVWQTSFQPSEVEPARALRGQSSQNR